MTMKVNRDEETGALVNIEIICDDGDCNLRPLQSEIIAGGGLLKMGWERTFDETDREYKHYCPEHRRAPPVEPRPVEQMTNETMATPPRETM
jgi:hypothetical protein